MDLSQLKSEFDLPHLKKVELYPFSMGVLIWFEKQSKRGWESDEDCFREFLDENCKPTEDSVADLNGVIHALSSIELEDVAQVLIEASAARSDLPNELSEDQSLLPACSKFKLALEKSLQQLQTTMSKTLDNITPPILKSLESYQNSGLQKVIRDMEANKNSLTNIHRSFQPNAALMEAMRSASLLDAQRLYHETSAFRELSRGLAQTTELQRLANA